MIRNCSRSGAILNAQAIQASAALFGHGDLVTMTIAETSVYLSISYDRSWYVYDREFEWLSERIMCGVSHQLDDDSYTDRFVINLIWDFNPQLR